MRRIRNLQDVVDWGLCIGCGACYFACGPDKVTLVNDEKNGIRPLFKSSCQDCGDCLQMCPGSSVDGTPAQSGDGLKISPEFGHYLGIWQGYAADPEIRHAASSGGLLSAFSLYCLQEARMELVIHSGMDDQSPWVNRTVVSRNREDLLRRTGSRYSPSSPCDGLEAVEAASGPCVFIGKPCDVSALAQLRKNRPRLDRNLGLVMTFFCAGTPSSGGTLNLAREMNVEREQIESIRYRGMGWPGRFTLDRNDSTQRPSRSYMESWGYLTRHRPLRCHLCPDGLGRTADLSCGDAWNDFDEKQSSEGRSLVIARSERGRQVIEGAIKTGYVQLHPVDAEAVEKAQVNLLKRRTWIFGRLTAMKAAGMPVPSFSGFDLWRGWRGTSLPVKGRTILGTLRRIVSRGWWRRLPQPQGPLVQPRPVPAPSSKTAPPEAVPASSARGRETA